MPTQEEQIHYAQALKSLKGGWTPATRKAYFSWFVKASQYKGGNSLRGFMANMKRSAIANLSEAEKEELKPIIDAKPASMASTSALPDRPFVKEWTLDELASTVVAGLTDRDYNRGRASSRLRSALHAIAVMTRGAASGPT